jgi:hypothetical protein
MDQGERAMMEDYSEDPKAEAGELEVTLRTAAFEEAVIRREKAESRVSRKEKE